MFTANNYYLCDNIDNEGNFRVVATMPIKGNEKLINNIRKNYGRRSIIPINETESILGIIRLVKSANGGRINRDLSIAEGRRGRDRKLDSVAIRRASNGRANAESTGGILRDEERAEIRNPFKPNDRTDDFGPLRFRVVDEDGREKALHRIKLSTITLL